jgi:hypothetical protein
MMIDMATPLINTVRKIGTVPLVQTIANNAKAASTASLSGAPAPVIVNSSPVNPGAISAMSTVRYGLIGSTFTIKNYGGL